MRKTITTMKEAVTVEVFCDVCGRPTHLKTGWEINDAEVEARIGDVYPEADCRHTYRIDLCATCFLDKLVPVVEKELGVTFAVVDADGDPVDERERRRELADLMEGAVVPSFTEAWKKKEDEGYQYGREALEGVRFGWMLRDSYGREKARKP